MITRLVSGLALTVIILSPSVIFAQEVSSRSIVDALSQPKTRSLVAPEPLAQEDQQLFDELATAGTRRIIVEERKKLTAAVEKYEMPSIDLDVYFNFDSYDIAAEAVPTLVELGTALLSPELRGHRFLVTGHTDGKGNDAYNLELSQQRADSVRVYLASTWGVPVEDLIAVGFGEEQLKVPGDPAAGENRRVTIIAITE
jgi:outer membrane protein OmpA-like peptidoglycan-associated protein